MRPPLPKAILTCAVTGNLTRPEQTPHLPVTPEQIATSALEAAKAGAAIVHLHVRDPQTGRLDGARPLCRRARPHPRPKRRGHRQPHHRTRRAVRARRGRPEGRGPWHHADGPERRVEHVARLRPDICTLDLNTMNSGSEVVINTPGNVRRMARVIGEAGVRPEIELFDSGDVALMRDLIADGTLNVPVLASFVMGVRYGFQPSPETVLYARGLLPADAQFTAIGVGRASFPMVAQSYLAGGHVRVGLEDTVYLDRGVLAPSNAALVEKARRIVADLGGQVATPREARALLGLAEARAPLAPAL